MPVVVGMPVSVMTGMPIMTGMSILTGVGMTGVGMVAMRMVSMAIGGAVVRLSHGRSRIANAPFSSSLVSSGSLTMGEANLQHLVGMVNRLKPILRFFLQAGIVDIAIRVPDKRQIPIRLLHLFQRRIRFNFQHVIARSHRLAIAISHVQSPTRVSGSQRI